jgi:hypothetical protein
MKQILIIPHRLPGMNEFAGRASRWHYTKLKAETQASIAAEIRRQHLKPMPYAYLSYIWFEPNRRRDLDNIASACKYINDALVACKILPNDGWENVLGIKHGFVVGDEASVHIELTDKPEA